MCLACPKARSRNILADHCGDDRFDCDLLRAIADANRGWGTSKGTDIVETVERWLAHDAASERASGAARTGADRLHRNRAICGRFPRVSSRPSPGITSTLSASAAAVGDLLRIQNGAAARRRHGRGAARRAAFAAAYSHAKRSAGRRRFRRSDPLDPGGCSTAPAWANGCATSSTSAPTISSSTKRRTPTPPMGHRPGADGRIFQRVERSRAAAAAPCSWSATSSRPFTASRAPIRASSSGRGCPRSRERARSDDGQRRCARCDFATFRSTPVSARLQAMLDVVDAVIDEVGFDAMGLPEAPNRRTVAHHRDAARARSSCGSRSRSTTRDDGEEGEEGWLDETRVSTPTRSPSRCKRWLDEAPMLASTKRPLTPGDILILVRSRGELASLIVARLFAARVPVAGIDRLHLVEAVRGARPARRGRLRGAAARRPQPRQSAGFAADRLGPAAAVRARLRARQDAAVAARCASGRGERRISRSAHEALGGLLAMADFTTPSRFLETILSGPLDGPAQALPRGSAWRRATRSTN